METVSYGYQWGQVGGMLSLVCLRVKREQEWYWDCIKGKPDAEVEDPDTSGQSGFSMI
jgi:hypothetical protein